MHDSISFIYCDRALTSAVVVTAAADGGIVVVCKNTRQIVKCSLFSILLLMRFMFGLC